MNVYDYKGVCVLHLCREVCRPHLALLKLSPSDVPVKKWTMVLFFRVGSGKFIWNICMHNMEYWTRSIGRGIFVWKID